MDFRNQSSYPIGLRNNNPGNIRPGSPWQGMVGTNNNFVVFSNMTYGLRALGIDISNKYFRGLNTITKIISVYAPPSENNTNAYINAVSGSTGIGANQEISLTKDVLKKMIRAIITHENGAQYAALIPDSEIEAGINAMPSNIILKIKGFLPPTRK